LKAAPFHAAQPVNRARLDTAIVTAAFAVPNVTATEPSDLKRLEARMSLCVSPRMPRALEAVFGIDVAG
jgi:hypothetical protein